MNDPGEKCELEQSDADSALETRSENRDATLALVERAHLGVSLFTPDLDPLVLDNAALERAISKLVRAHKGALIRILVQDSAKAVTQGHCLIRLAQALTSSVLIHNPALEHRNEHASFMVVDALGILYRPRSARNDYSAVFNDHAPQRARKLKDHFNAMWERSTPDSQIRRLYILQHAQDRYGHNNTQQPGRVRRAHRMQRLKPDPRCARRTLPFMQERFSAANRYHIAPERSGHITTQQPRRAPAKPPSAESLPAHPDDTPEHNRYQSPRA